MQSGASADLSGLFDQPVHTLNLTPAHGGASIYQQSSLQVPGVNTPYGIQQNTIPGFQQNQIGGYQQTSMGGYQQNPMGGFQPNHMGGLPAPNNKMGMGMNPFNGPGLGVQIPQMQYNPGVYSVLQVGSGIQAGLRTAPPPPNQAQVQVPFSSPVPISHPSLQSSSSGPSLILSRSFTEPRPMEDDLDPLYSNSNSTSTGLVEEFPLESGNHSSFYLEENEEEEEETSEGENEREKMDAPVAGEERKDGEQTSQGTKKSFFSLFSRAKDPGVQEKEEEKKTVEEEEEGRGGNEQKFLGEGQTFKGKLIGVLEVREARGDRMCQDALQELKMAIKASGEHKQKVIMQIAVDGLKIRDEKTGDCLYHHPVHKISFIAQDMTDIRAFGYIYGSPENGHRFFGIKTEKAAGQVVVAMRDLFQVVFELKKKEIEEAKSNMDKGEEHKVGSAASFPAAAGQPEQQTAVDDLLGLVSEITAIQAGIQQIDKITPTPPNSFQTDSMITFSLPATTSPPIPAPLPRKPVAVMNTNPKPEGFRTAPFLPPPPSKGGKRDDRYAALESFAPPQSTTGGGDTFPSIFTIPPSLNTETQPAIFSQTSTFPQTFPSQNSFGNGDAAFSQTSEFPSGGFSSNGFSSGAFTPSGFSTAVFPPERVAGGYPQPSQQQFPQAFSFQTQPPGFPNQTTGFNTQPTGFPIQSAGFPAQQSNVYNAIHNIQDSKPGAPADKLDSLFTDLDPLGSGKHKSFTDSPDVFSMNGSPRTGGGGASQDSLSNVGFVDIPWESSTNQQSEFFKTNNVQSLSSPFNQTQQRRISENSLRVALPPEEGRGSVSPGDLGLNPHSSSYGSILELEASPRRYRQNDLHDLYSTSQDSPSCSSRYGDGKDSSVDSSLNIPMPPEPPPALPERPPKSSSLSPPPLPPKKQLYPLCVNSYPTVRGPEPREGSKNITEVKPDQTHDIIPILRTGTSEMYEDVSLYQYESNIHVAEPEISLQDLVKMNMIELSQKLSEGKLPRYLSGMSLFELVDYIGKHGSTEPSEPRQKEEVSLRTTVICPPEIFSGSSESTQPPTQYYTPRYAPEPGSQGLTGPGVQQKLDEEHPSLLSMNPENNVQDIYVQGSTYSLNSISSSSHNPSSSQTNTSPRNLPERSGLGFEDDFSHFNPNSKKEEALVFKSPNLSGTVPEKCETYDRYAVFRELQLEEELVNAWKSPTEETKDINGDLIIQETEIEEEQETFTEEKEDTFLDAEDEDRSMFEQNTMIFSPVISPVQQNQEFIEEQDSLDHASKLDNYDIDLDMDLENKKEFNEVNDVNEGNDMNDMNDVTGVADMNDVTGVADMNDANDATDVNDTYKENNESITWATFEDPSRKGAEFSNFINNDEQEKTGNKISKFKPEFMRKDSYAKLDENQGGRDEIEEQEQRGKFSIQSPKSLRDLPTTISFQARYQNFKRFDQPPVVQKVAKPSFKNQRLTQEEDAFESEWEPAFYTRNQTENEYFGKPNSWDLSFQKEENSPKRLAVKHSNLEEAFPQEYSGRNSATSSENMFNNPFNDNFVTTNNCRTDSATPPVFEGDRISNHSELSFQSGDFLNSSMNMFERGERDDRFERGEEDDIFKESEFRIEAKTKVSKSDSVNIFSAAEDPFDDDFFK